METQRADSLLKRMDALIRAGRSRDVKQALSKLNPQKIPRSSLLPLAALARRANLPQLSLQLLHPIVRGEKEVATVAEKAEYAASLTFIGAGTEAIEILKVLEPEDCPDVLLFQAFALFNRWDYKGSIDFLDRYIRHPDVPPYMRLVGKLNLSAALVNERILPTAEELLNEVKEEAEAGDHKLILGNTLELLAQIALLRNFLSTAERLLLEATHLLKDTGGLYSLFIRKWLAITHLKQHFEKADPTLALEKLRKVRVESLQRSNWETARDCDRNEAICMKDEKLLWKVYFGSPFPAYRYRLVHEYGQKLKIPELYFLNLQPAHEPKTIIDIDTGEIVRRTVSAATPILIADLREEPLLHATMKALAEDFYSPLRLPRLAAVIFPDENYVPGKSAARAYRSLQKLRSWLAAKQIDVEVSQSNSFYTLKSEQKIALKITAETSSPAVKKAA